MRHETFSSGSHWSSMYVSRLTVPYSSVPPTASTLTFFPFLAPTLPPCSFPFRTQKRPTCVPPPRKLPCYTWRLTLRQFASTMDFHSHQSFPFLDEALFRASSDPSALPSSSMSPQHCSQGWYANRPCTTRLTPQNIAASIAPRYIADSPCIQLIGPLAVRFSHSQLPRGALGS